MFNLLLAIQLSVYLSGDPGLGMRYYQYIPGGDPGQTWFSWCFSTDCSYRDVYFIDQNEQIRYFATVQPDNVLIYHQSILLGPNKVSVYQSGNGSSTFTQSWTGGSCTGVNTYHWMSGPAPNGAAQLSYQDVNVTSTTDATKCSLGKHPYYEAHQFDGGGLKRTQGVGWSQWRSIP